MGLNIAVSCLILYFIFYHIFPLIIIIIIIVYFVKSTPLHNKRKETVHTQILKYRISILIANQLPNLYEFYAEYLRKPCTWKKKKRKEGLNSTTFEHQK